MPGNENDLGGYSEQELYVSCRYDSYKEEILAHLDKGSYV